MNTSVSVSDSTSKPLSGEKNTDRDSVIVYIDGDLFARMVQAGAAVLQNHRQQVNDLNVFPIPDGDTGDNMLLTVASGADATGDACHSLCEMAHRVAGGMLLGARGNSGVILSQFFDGIAKGLDGQDKADAAILGQAFSEGVRHAYAAVLTPAEGTVLTVIREATQAAIDGGADTPLDFLELFLAEARRSLARTPDLLPVLKEAGVVDSGGAGLIHIVEGMAAALQDGQVSDLETYHMDNTAEPHGKLDLDAFGVDSVLEFGYCTELLLRLQRAKCDPETFDVGVITAYLSGIGNSVVAFKTDSVVKLHVHTMTPDKVLAFCQQFGEFLTVKIENMSLQHNNTVVEAAQHEPDMSPRKPFGVVAVASGEGIKETFRSMGADQIVDGGQSMNPSTEAFLEAFRAVNADTVLVLPNNSNVILAARQAASLYSGADVRVLDSHTVGEGYAALSMLDTTSGDADQIVADLTQVMSSVITASVSACVREVDMDGIQIHPGDSIGFVGKKILSSGHTRTEAACGLVDALDFQDREVCILICGEEASKEEGLALRDYIVEHHPLTEVYMIHGGQKIYDYMLILE
jgi:hypothetical protein